MGCCGQGNEPTKDALLGRLRTELGVTLPDRAQLWGPRDGFAWRVVDVYGRELDPPLVGRVHHHQLLGEEPLCLLDGPAGERVVVAVPQPPGAAR